MRGIPQLRTPDLDARLYQWAERIRENAPYGSPVRKAFATFDEHCKRPSEVGFGVKHACFLALAGLSAEQQSEIWNGWHVDNDRPEAQQMWRDMARGEVEDSLAITCSASGEVCIEKRFRLGDGSAAPVRVEIIEGTDRPTALAALRTITAAVERHFAAGIQLRDSEEINASAGEFLPDVASVESALSAVEEVMGRVKEAAKALESPFTKATVAIAEPARSDARRFAFRDSFSDEQLRDYSAFIFSSPTPTIEQCKEWLTAQGVICPPAIPVKKPHSVTKNARKLGGRERKSKAKAAS